MYFGYGLSRVNKIYAFFMDGRYVLGRAFIYNLTKDIVDSYFFSLIYVLDLYVAIYNEYLRIGIGNIF